MRNLYFRVITMVITLYSIGTMPNTSRKSNVLFNSECQQNGYLPKNSSSARKHAIQVDTSQTLVTEKASFSFFRFLLQSNLKKEEWVIKHLDLSDNLIPEITISTFACLHGLEILNLSKNEVRFISLDLPSHKSSWVKHHKVLPFLKVLILQRNKLSDIPKGLWKLRSLQSLDLSFNGITEIGLADFRNCLQLENLYLKSNKIFRIHPEAFKNLKSLQVVDLSSNALTTVLPMVAIALELPHLEVDLTGNQWQCDDSVVVFQDFISESWRKKWHEICSKSRGNKEAFWWTPQIRVSRKTQLPHIHLNRMKKIPASLAERPQEGMSMISSTPGKTEPVSSGFGEKHRRLPRSVRDAWNDRTLGRKEEEDTSQDLTLAICLSVFITFFLAFCLGALTRPCIDRLWQQRCWNKSPPSTNTYSNEGFHDETQAAQNLQPPVTFPGQVFPDLNLYENQDSVKVIPRPHTAVTHDRALRSSRKGAGSWQSSTQCGNNTGAGSRNALLLPRGRAVRSIDPGHPNATTNKPVSAEQDPIYDNDSTGELNLGAMVQDNSRSRHSMGASSVADRLPAVSGSSHGSNELNPMLSREMTTSVPKMQMQTNAWKTGENEEREYTKHPPSGAPGSQLEFCEDLQMNTYTNLPNTQQQKLKEVSPEKEASVYYSTVTYNDPGDTDPSVFPPSWGHSTDVTPAHKEPRQNCVPSDTQFELETNYDSDEGSLFTLSSVSTEHATSDDEAKGEQNYRAGEPPENQNLGQRIDSIRPLDSLEDSITFPNSPVQYENREDFLEKHHVSGPDSGLWKTHQENVSNTNTSEDPLTLPRYLTSSPLSVEIPGTFIYDDVVFPQSEAVEWKYSLRDLEFEPVDI